MTLDPWPGLFACCLLCTGTALAAAALQEPAARERAQPPRKIEPPARELPDATAWQAMIARDHRIAFTPRTASDARAALDGEDVPVERRAAAWIALGAAGSIGERPLLEELAKSAGTPSEKGIERLAAVLALGEIAASVDPLLFDLASHGPPEVAECALLALLRTDRASSRRRVEEIARDPADPATRSASGLLVFDVAPESSAPTRAAVLLLDLRWEAARSFGLVDGQSWSVLRIRELGLDATFLRELVLLAAAHLKRPGIKDHLLTELVAGEGPARLRAAVQALPRELYQLVDSGLWAPKDLFEWTVILDQIGELALEPLTIELLERASHIEELHYRAIAMLARTNQVELVGRIDADLARLSREDRLWAIEAVGASGEIGWTKRLAPLREDESPAFRTAALVALARLGLKKAELDVRTILGDADHADHAALALNLCRTTRDPWVSALLESYLGEARGAEAIAIATALTLDGRLSARLSVRAALAVDPPPRGAYAVRLVRALRRNATAEDLEIFRRLFPRPDEPELNVELAVALTELGDPVILAPLRAALWGADWEQSVLAGGLIVEIAGIQALRGELARAPRTASSNDVRRVGYAIGAWGGLVQVEGLARELRYNSGHPALQGALLGFLSARTQ